MADDLAKTMFLTMLAFDKKGTMGEQIGRQIAEELLEAFRLQGIVRRVNWIADEFERIEKYTYEGSRPVLNPDWVEPDFTFNPSGESYYEPDEYVWVEQ